MRRSENERNLEAGKVVVEVEVAGMEEDLVEAGEEVAIKGARGDGVIIDGFYEANFRTMTPVARIIHF